MQISHTLPPSALPLSLEQQRDASSKIAQTLPLVSQVGKVETTLRSVESVKQAEQVLQRHRSERGLTQMADDPRNQRAVMSYQSVQTDQERDYVSEVLGIDVYA